MEPGSTKPLPAESVASTVRRLAKEHNAWRGRCLNLIPSENVTSLAVREFLTADFAHRYAEGDPFQRYYCGTKFIDEVETMAVQLTKELFNAEHVNVRVISGAQANMALFYALTKPGDSIMTLPVPCGGHISYMKFGCAGARGLKVEKIPFNAEEMTIDETALAAEVEKLKPAIVLLGGSVMLFPQPLEAARKATKEYGGFVAYDAAHVLGLIAGGCFQDPLREGADVVTGSTHKTLPGPQGGLILSTRNLAESIDNAVFPGLVSNHHLHRLAALTVALAEMKAFGKDYAKDTIKNAKALAKALHECGFHVPGRNKGFTESHQVLLEVSGLGGGDTVAKRLESANIVSNKNLLPHDKLKNALNPSGLRLGTQEVTRLGMGPSEMTTIAELFKTLLLEGKDPNLVASDVEKLVKDFQTVKYSFDSHPDAYRYFYLY